LVKCDLLQNAALLILLLSIVGVVIFSGYVLYDISLIKYEIQNGELKEKNDLSIHVLNLYLDFINLLLDILNIFSFFLDD
jgi:FtsH-binding integral membrane protein